MCGRAFDGANLLRRLGAFIPSERFRADFWPVFWGAIIATGLAIWSALFVDRWIKQKAAQDLLPEICKQLKSSEISLSIFANGDAQVQLRPIHTVVHESFLVFLDDPVLIYAVDDAYSSIQEVNRILEQYQSLSLSPIEHFESSAKRQQQLDSLARTSNDALGKVQSTTRKLVAKLGAADCN